MNKVTFEKLDTNFLETIKDYKKIHLKPDEGTYYTILVDGQKAGAIGFKIEENGWPGLKIGIHQDFRGQGIFGLALDLLAKKHDLKEIYSEVAVGNIQSVKAHQKVGFTRIPIEEENELKEKGLVYRRNMVLMKKLN